MEMAMTFVLFRTGRTSAHQSDDHLLSCDTVPPNHRAHRRGFMLILVMIGVAAALAVVATTLQGVSDMGAAFPDVSALGKADAWDRFFAGFGRVALLVLAFAVVVLVARRRTRKQKAPAAAKH
jgi:hypothetical protein